MMALGCGYMFGAASKAKGPGGCASGRAACRARARAPVQCRIAGHAGEGDVFTKGLMLGAAVALSASLGGPAVAAIIVGDDYQPALGMKPGIPEQCVKVCKKNPPACAPCKKRVAQGLQ